MTRLQRCSSSEPSLHGNENSATDNTEITRRFSTSSSCTIERPTTPLTPMSWASSTISTPFTPVTPLSPFWSPVSTPNTQGMGEIFVITGRHNPAHSTDSNLHVDEDQIYSDQFKLDVQHYLRLFTCMYTVFSVDLLSTIPCVYFEAELKESGRRAKNIGYFCHTSRESCSCEFYDGHTMSFPSELAKSDDVVRAPSVIGCGLLLPDGVFFTLDGVYHNTVFPYTDVSYEDGQCLPYITYPNVKVNYGQEEFLLEKANASGQRVASAQLLHSFSRQLLEKMM